MTRIILIASEAQRLARGALAAASPDDVTPIITGAKLTVDATGKVTMAATDRYRVHRIFTDAVPRPAENRTEDGLANIWDEGSVILPREALKWISANALKLKFYSHVVIEFEPYVEATYNPATLGELGRIRIEVRAGMPDGSLLPDEEGMYAYACRPVAGRYPPVERLFDGLQWSSESNDKGVLLNIDFVAGLKPLAVRKGANARIRFTKPNDYGKPGPVGFSFEDNGKVYADAIIQPNLELR